MATIGAGQARMAETDHTAGLHAHIERLRHRPLGDAPYSNRRGAAVSFAPTPIPMSNTSVRYAVPQQCRFCETLGAVSLETTVHGRAVELTWCCRNCGRDWPVVPQEQVTTERRGGPADRRRATRAERRAS